MSVRCASCKNRLVQKAADGVHVRAGGALVFLPDGSCMTKCHFCKADVLLPVTLEKSAVPEAPPLVIDVVRKPRTS